MVPPRPSSREADDESDGIDRLGRRVPGTLIPRVAESQNRIKNIRHEEKPDAEPRSFSETPAHVQVQQKSDEDIHEWDKHHEHPSAWLSRNLAENV